MNVSGDLLVHYNYEAVNQTILNMIFSSPTDTLFRVNTVINIESYLNDLASVEKVDEIREVILESLSDNLPFLEIIDLNININSEEEVLYISLQYKLPERYNSVISNNSETLEIPISF